MKCHEFCTVKEACAYLGYQDINEIYKLIKAGAIAVFDAKPYAEKKIIKSTLEAYFMKHVRNGHLLK